MGDLRQKSNEGAWLVIMFLWVFPLFVQPRFSSFPHLFTSAYTSITQTKMLAHVAVVSVFLLIMLVTGVAKLVRNRPRLSLPRETSWDSLPELFLALFLIGALLSWLVSPYFGQLGPTKIDATYVDLPLLGTVSLGPCNLDLIWFGAGRFDGLFFWVTYLALFWMVSRVCTFRHYHLKGFAVVLTAMCLIAVVQLCGVNALLLYPAAGYKGFPNNFLSTIGNVDMVSGFLSMALPLVGVGYIVFKPNRWMSALYLTAHTLAAYVLLSIDVDSGLVALAALVLVVGPLLLRNRRYACKVLDVAASLLLGAAAASAVDHTYVKADQMTVNTVSFGKTTVILLVLVLAAVGLRLLLTFVWNNRKIPWQWVRRGLWALEGLALVGAFLYFRFVYQPAARTGLLTDLYELARGELSLTAGHNRVGIWTYSLQMAREHWWLGTGTGTFAKSFKAFAAKAGYTRYANRNLDFAHNEYIHILCTQGVLGLVTYVGFLASTAWRALRKMGQNPKVLVLGAAVFGYAVQLFFSFNVVIVAPVFWTLLGLLVGEIRAGRQPALTWTPRKQATIPSEPAESAPDAPNASQPACDPPAAPL